MHTGKVRKVGGSMMVAIPKPLVDELNLQPNVDLEMTISNGKLVMDPHMRRRYTVTELLARCTPGPLAAEDGVWLDGPIAGREDI